MVPIFPPLPGEEFVHSITSTNSEILIALGIVWFPKLFTVACFNEELWTNAKYNRTINRYITYLNKKTKTGLIVHNY